jgi:hypothetical protein
MLNPNLPVWTPNRPRGREKFQEVWYLKLNDRTGNHALWLRFTLLVTKNGFQRLAETWAIFFQREANRDVSKSAVKQSFGIQTFESLSDSGSDSGIRIGNCTLTPERTHGQIQSKGKSISWDLSIQRLQEEPISLFPESIAKLGFVKSEAWTISEEMLFSGKVVVDGTEYEFHQAPGVQGHWSGVRNAHSWVWGQANSFQNEKGDPVSFIFEGITSRPRLNGNVAGPKLSSYYFYYKGEHYRFNKLWDAFHLKSESSITQWQFQADRGEISFRGTASADHKDFAGITLEDTDSSILYCANSKLSNMSVHVYRRGKLEATFLANGTAAFEVVSRNKNPYVQTLI